MCSMDQQKTWLATVTCRTVVFGATCCWAVSRGATVGFRSSISAWFLVKWEVFLHLPTVLVFDIVGDGSGVVGGHCSRDPKSDLARVFLHSWAGPCVLVRGWHQVMIITPSNRSSRDSSSRL